MSVNKKLEDLFIEDLGQVMSIEDLAKVSGAGKENPITTTALGEEDDDPITTTALGEEDGDDCPITTTAIGEE